MPVEVLRITLLKCFRIFEIAGINYKNLVRSHITIADFKIGWMGVFRGNNFFKTNIETAAAILETNSFFAAKIAASQSIIQGKSVQRPGRSGTIIKVPAKTYGVRGIVAQKGAQGKNPEIAISRIFV